MSRQENNIAKLRIYQASRQLEDQVFELVRTLPSKEFYGLGDDLRRSSAAISHYLAAGHHRFSLGLKLEAVHLARTEAQQLQQHLQEYTQRGYGDTTKLQATCTGIIKQAWGLISYLKRRQAHRQNLTQIQAADSLATARAHV